MKVHKEISLTEFDFWAGAKDTVIHLTDEELDQIEGILKELVPDGLTENDLNDLFWHEVDLIAEWLGFESFEELMERDE